MEIEELTPNRVLAYNLAKARALRGWTQEEAAKRLEEHLGTRWSKAVFSAAEAGRTPGRRVRLFDADEIVAFAKAFGLSVSFFFMPPPGHDWEPQFPVTETSLDLLDYVVGSHGEDEQGERVEQILRNVPAELTDVRERLEDQAALFAARALVHAMGDLEEQSRKLREWAARFHSAHVIYEQSRALERAE